jgi:hypothetical protein
VLGREGGQSTAKHDEPHNFLAPSLINRSWALHSLNERSFESSCGAAIDLDLLS